MEAPNRDRPAAFTCAARYRVSFLRYGGQNLALGLGHDITGIALGQGTGLGLSICYGTVKEHNSEIYAQNLQPNGAAVTIELPAA